MNKIAPRYDCLDLLRGCAALLVLTGHLRAYVFQNFNEAMAAGMGSGLLVKAFYFATSLGHQAVIVFFALSGFLVGGKAVEDILVRRFSWSRYLLRRLTRLWIVIVPALLFTLVLDKTAMSLAATGYDGRFYQMYASGPRADVPISHSFLTWLGNVAFLQTIVVPCFGSNGPLWSLANEFWYYMLFPLGFWVIAARAGIATKLAGAVLLTVLVAFLPYWLLQGGFVWGAGAAAAWVRGCHEPNHCWDRGSLAPYRSSSWLRASCLPAAVTGLATSVLEWELP
jgi:peptidoglycan/LPS O-acetylase OafA/YrhL